jgi:hypothetical protein
MSVHFPARPREGGIDLAVCYIGAIPDRIEIAIRSMPRRRDSRARDLSAKLADLMTAADDAASVPCRTTTV